MFSLSVYQVAPTGVLLAESDSDYLALEPSFLVSKDGGRRMMDKELVQPICLPGRIGALLAEAYIH